MRIIYTKRHRVHGTDEVLVDGRPLENYEVPARAEAILDAIYSARIGSVTAPTDHGLEPILAVHDADYVAFLRTVYAESAAYFQEAGPVSTWTFASRHAVRRPKGFLGLKGYYAFSWGTPILDGTWEAAYWSAQSALTAASLVGNGQRVVYALCRPPGHHAAADLYGGYYYLNNAAIAARYLQAQFTSRRVPPSGDLVVDLPATKPRVAILDVDHHHGNGTQILFYSDPTVLFCSLHAHPDEEYPYYWGGADEIGEGDGAGANRNWPLPRGTGDADYSAALREALATTVTFDPHYLIVSAGFDTVAGDPEGGFNLTTDGIHEIGERIASLDLPTVIVQEGGYRLDRLGINAVAFLQPFARQA
jgi:acetoin utilization deacetylase AcuC-like enzyme